MTETTNRYFNGIERRVWNLQTHTPITIPLYGYYNDRGEYIHEGSTTLNVYKYNHDYKKLYREFELDPAVRLEDYEAPYFEQACYKGIPMRLRYNPTIRNLMKTKNFRIKYRGGSKPQYNYKRLPNHTLAEYADTFAIYPK